MIDLSPTHLATVKAILAEHVPECEVRAFGSRATWTAKDYSDLDLAIVGEGPVDWKTLGRLKEAFEESDLPIRVDVLDWHAISDNFKKVVERGCEVVWEKASERSTANAGDSISIDYGTFRRDFQVDSLGNLCSSGGGIQTGPFGSQLHKRDYVPVGTPIITVEHLGDNRITHSDLPRVSDHDRDRLSKYMLRRGDIVFSRVGSVDRRGLVREAEEGWLFSGRCLRIRPDAKKVLPAYLSYYFGLPQFQEYIRSIAVGATMPSLNTRILSDVLIAYPAIPEQRTIAQVLGTLDDKIELNRRMNETLEEMARSLFKSWFVDFDPVRAKMEGRWRRGESLPGLPADLYDLFPDHLVPSELGEIPEGWHVKTLGELVELAYGKALRAADRRGGPIPVYGSNGQVGWHDKRLVAGPGIVVGRKGNPGVVTWAHTDFFPIDTAFHVVRRDASCGLPFLFFALTSQGLPSISADSAVPGLNRNLAYMNKQLLPGEHVLAEFNDYARAIFSRGHRLQEESRALATQREALLPGFVSGEVGVNGVSRWT